ncbi:MAG: hypothetical protein R3Y66_01050 [Rikenellaceae bacterium]
MKELAKDNYDFANSYLNTITSSFSNPNRKFDNDLLYNMIAICFEKFMIAWLAHHDSIATSHLPLMLYREVNDFEPDLSLSLRKTAVLVGSFEGICSIDDFGYRTPDNPQIDRMIEGLNELKDLVTERLKSATETD